MIAAACPRHSLVSPFDELYVGFSQEAKRFRITMLAIEDDGAV